MPGSRRGQGRGRRPRCVGRRCAQRWGVRKHYAHERVRAVDLEVGPGGGSGGTICQTGRRL
eukprot:3149624-Pyramimonas_sp.AAC.1